MTASALPTLRDLAATSLRRLAAEQDAAPGDTMTADAKARALAETRREAAHALARLRDAMPYGIERGAAEAHASDVATMTAGDAGAAAAFWEARCL